MADGVEAIETETSTVSEETQRLAELGRQGHVEHRDPLVAPLAETPRPAHIPEKFWDPVKGEVRLDELAKSYTELEKMRGQKVEAPAEDDPKDPEGDPEDDPKDGPKDDPKDPEGDPEDDPKDPEGEDKEDGEDEGEPPAPSAELNSAIENAKAAYAETGELSEEARKPLIEAGISNEQIDFYIDGIKAREAALWGAALEEAGSDEDLEAARQWAAANWSEKKIASFDSQTGDVETVRLAVTGLMAEYRKANPSEGKLTTKTTGMTHGDVYKDIKEYHADLAKADAARDQAGRKAAIEKMRRSRQAGSFKQAPRRQPFGN